MSQIIIRKNIAMTQRAKELVNNLVISTNAKETIDLSKIHWITPLSILPLAYKVFKLQSEHELNIIYPDSPDIKSYLQTILFPKGTNDPFLINYGSTYVPIVRIEIKSGLTTTQPTIDILIDKYEKIMLNHLFTDQFYKRNVSQALRQFIAEMADNVREHSAAREFWILSQCWSRSGELEICMLDDGIGFRQSYEKAGISVKDDIDAIDKVIQGISTKKLSGSSFGERGYGVRTSINLMTKSDLKGEIIIISGSAGYYAKGNQTPILFRIPDYNWHGVLIATRVHKPLTQINIYDYIE